MANIRTLYPRHEKIWERMMPWRPIWQDLSDFMIPRKHNISSRALYGPRRGTDRMIDETGAHAATLLTSTMAGSLTNPSSRWFGLTQRDRMLREIAEWQEWTEGVSSDMYEAFQQSNIEEEVQEGYYDLSIFGISAIFMDEVNPPSPRFTGFRFEALQVGDYAIDEGSDGMVDTLHREIWMSNRAIVDRWGFGRAANSETWKTFVRKAEKDPFTLSCVAHAIYPRPNSRKDGFTRRRSQEMPFESVYFLKEEKVILEEGGFEEFPYLVPRWAKASGEIYGRGPGLLALPAVKTLCRAIELDLKSWAKDLDPPLKSLDRGVVGRVKTSPGSNNIVRNMEAIGPLFDKGRGQGSYQPTQIRVERLERKIREIFFYDQLQLPGGQEQNTYMTATEVERRYQLMQRVLGPTLGRLKHELLRPLVERGFKMMARKGFFPTPPEITADEEDGRRAGGNPQLDVVYEGPLERAARASALEGINRAWASTAPFVEAKPEVLDVLDFDEMTRVIWSASGTPAKILKDARRVKSDREAKQAAMAEEAQRVRDMEAAEAAGKAAPAIKAAGEAGGLEGILAGGGEGAQGGEE